MDTENWLPAVEEVLDTATQWLRSIGPAELDQVPDWGIWVILAIGVLVVFSIISHIVSALLRPIVRLVQILAFLAIAAAAGVYILRELGYVNIGIG
ncbi:MAG: hypothetical protein OXE05_13780 [Chloroflexi bacterium]|nr:hypothetical protein [Chloroflexota bacterium]